MTVSGSVCLCLRLRLRASPPHRGNLLGPPVPTIMRLLLLLAVALSLGAAASTATSDPDSLSSQPSPPPPQLPSLALPPTTAEPSNLVPPTRDAAPVSVPQLPSPLPPSLSPSSSLSPPPSILLPEAVAVEAPAQELISGEPPSPPLLETYQPVHTPNPSPYPDPAGGAVESQTTVHGAASAADSVGGRVAALLSPGQTLRLVPDDLEENSSKACTEAEVLRATFPTFSLPTGGRHLALLLHIAALDCSAGQRGALLAFGGASSSSTTTTSDDSGGGDDGTGRSPAWDVAVDCASGELLLSSAGTGGAGGGTARFPLPEILGPDKNPARPASLTLLLALDQQQRSFEVCANGVQLAPPPGATAGATSTASNSAASAMLDQLSGAVTSSLLGLAVVLGGQQAVRADITAAYVTDAPLPCARTAPGEVGRALLAELAAAASASGSSAGGAPELAVEQEHGGDGEVGREVRLRATAVPASTDDNIRLRLTFFGLTPPGCTAAECGDAAVQSEAPSAPGQPASLAATAAYPKAGRYVVRLEATTGRGWVTTHDHAIIIRKRGDPGSAASPAALSTAAASSAGPSASSASPAAADGGAPCCRHTAGVVAQQLGRPISDTEYRSGTAARQAAALGWSQEYLQHEEREAERLFEYSVLAPLVARTPLRLTTCADTRLAGAGSPLLFGTSDLLAHHSHGHNKRLALLPAGFAWATSTDQVSCQEHWTGWHQASPYKLPNGRGGVCSATCTQQGTLQLLRETGMFEQYNQALIAASYGQLSLSADVAVLAEVSIPYNTDNPSNFSYYEELPLKAMSAVGETPWMWLVLAPVAQHRVPPFNAWSGGRGAGGAVIAQCFPTAYYAVHETGHRLGFRHANMYRIMTSATSAPVDPLGPGETTSVGYSDRLDIMACCRGDYGLYYRLMAGWLRGGPAERAVMGVAELATPTQRRFSLWPFDRPESRGNLMALTIRRNENEVLIVGFRSAPHWQDISISGGDVAPADSRHNVRGLSVELVRRDPATGQWADHRGLLDFNLLSGDWPDALPAQAGDFPRESAFALLKEGTAWHDPASGLLLSFEAVGGCAGAPGLPLYNHSALNFYGFRGEWPGQELPQGERADFAGFQSLECAQLVLTTATPAPQGRLEFSVEAAPAAQRAATVGPSMWRRGLRMQPQGTAAGGQMTAGGGDGDAISGGSQAGSCGVPLAPTLRLRLPAGQQLSSVIWKDSLNRTVHVQDGVSLAAAAASSAGGASWTTAAVALPPLYPFAESSSDPAPGCGDARAGCQSLQRRCTVLLLAADGRYSRATISLPPPTLEGLRLSVSLKHYERSRLTHEQRSLTVPVGWPPAAAGDSDGSSAAGTASSSPSGVVIYDSRFSGGRELALQTSTAVVPGSSLPSAACSRQWSLSMQLSLTGAGLAAAAGTAEGQVLLSADGGFPSVSLGPSLLPSAPSSQPALWLHWSPRNRRRVALPRPLASLRAGQMGLLHLVVVRDGSRVGLFANQQWGGWVLPDLSCIPSRPSITYCDHSPDTAASADGSSSSSSSSSGGSGSGGAAFRPPGKIELGAAAAAAAAGPGMPAAAADAGLLWARFYSYALPEGDLATEAGADAAQLQQYFRVQSAGSTGSSGSSGEGGSGRSAELRPLLVVPPGQDGGEEKQGGLPIAVLAAAAGGGAAALAIAALLWCWCRRRGQRKRAEREMERLSADSAGSFKSAGKAEPPAPVTAL